VAEFRKIAARHIEVLNAATADIPPESMRLHLCWGNYSGPHHHDIELSDILDLVYTARPHAISIEGANPRHGHEWTVFDRYPLPDGKIIIPGVIDSTSNFIEHPELVAQRICAYASKVGRERVIAGADCGFATFAERPAVDPDIAWAKLGALVEGAALASDRLW
jgi:5-methyltetrahydropteroyltriglutamate--homocysteine methyltransferase